MALGTFAVGNYAMTYDGTTVGIVKTGEMYLIHTPLGEDIDDAQPYGKMVIDDINMGQNVDLVVIFKEWNSVVKKILFPHGTIATPTMDGKFGMIGRLGSAVAKAMVLTAESGSPAASAGPATLTANLVKISPNNDFRMLLGPRVRDIAVKLRLLPFDDAGTVKHYNLT